MGEFQPPDIEDPRDDAERLEDAYKHVLAERKRFAQYIVVNCGGKNRVRDHACAQCFPDGEQVVPFFVCAYHAAVLVSAQAQPL
jgi:hypothetical protein